MIFLFIMSFVFSSKNKYVDFGRIIVGFDRNHLAVDFDHNYLAVGFDQQQNMIRFSFCSISILSCLMISIMWLYFMCLIFLSRPFWILFHRQKCLETFLGLGMLNDILLFESFLSLFLSREIIFFRQICIIYRLIINLISHLRLVLLIS